MISAARYSWIVPFLASSLALGQTTSPPVPTTSTPAQTAAATKIEMPSDPAALLALAAKKNGLQNAGVSPWHLKATYEILDEKGGGKEAGTFEEWWFSDQKYKLSYSDPTFNQTDYSTEKGLFRIGSAAWPDEPRILVQRSFSPSFPTSDDQGKRKFKANDKKLGPVLLRCVIADNSSAITLPSDSVHCFNQDAPELRVELASVGLYEFVYNHVGLFRGAYVARNFQATRLSKPFLRVQLDMLEDIDSLPEEFLTPPSTATAIERRAFLDFGMSEGILRKVPPRYPVQAKAALVQGIVYLLAITGKDGAVVDVRPIEGPPMLIDASIEAVRKWVYKPYLVGDEPVEIETVVRVVYSLGG